MVESLSKSKKITSITVANGDGIGEDIMHAVLQILKEAGFALGMDFVEIGKAKFEKKYVKGMSDDDLKVILKNPVFLKGPITTPQGKGYRSINVTLRRELGLFANVRRCRAYDPFVHSSHPEIDVVIVRENEEDLYSGLEYRQTFDAYKAIKNITKFNSTRICQYAFEYARANNRKSVSCCVKDNIMKLTDGAFANCFRDVAVEYNDISNEYHNVDIAAGWLAAKPGKFDVIVTENLYGDIISDIAAEVAGSIGLSSGANIGTHYAMFEAVHGSAPGMAPDTANPSALLLGAIDMLVHIGMMDMANVIYNAWLSVLESGVHTQDIYKQTTSKQMVGTKDFALAVISALGSKPKKLKPSAFAGKVNINPTVIKNTESKSLVGFDVCLDWSGEDVKELVDLLIHSKGEKLSLRSVFARGLSVWPKAPNLSIEPTTYYRCVFTNILVGENILHDDVDDVLVKLRKSGLEVVSMDKLYSFDGKPGFTALSEV